MISIHRIYSHGINTPLPAFLRKDPNRKSRRSQRKYYIDPTNEEIINISASHYNIPAAESIHGSLRVVDKYINSRAGSRPKIKHFCSQEPFPKCKKII